MKRTYTLGLILAFCFGFLGKTILDESGVDIVSVAYAQVAGMDYRELRRDRDFRKAVRYIVEDCQVRDDRITC